jgi:hypothetical protein
MRKLLGPDRPITAATDVYARFSAYVEDERAPDFLHASALAEWCLAVCDERSPVQARVDVIVRLISNADRFMAAAELISLAEPFAAFIEGRSSAAAQAGGPTI